MLTTISKILHVMKGQGTVPTHFLKVQVQLGPVWKLHLAARSSGWIGSCASLLLRECVVNCYEETPISTIYPYNN